MDNNSFDIEVEPMDIPTASENDSADSGKQAVNDDMRNKPEKTPEAEVKEPVKKRKELTSGMLALIVLIIIAAGIVSIVFSVKASAAHDKAEHIWKNQFNDISWDPSLVKGVTVSNYNSLSKKEQLEVDYKILLMIAADKDGHLDGYSSLTDADYARAVKLYLRFSKGGLQSRKREIVAEFDKIAGKDYQYDLEYIDWDIDDKDYEQMAIKFISTVPIKDHSMDGFFIEIADNVYKDEMINGCARIIADSQTGNSSVNQYVNRARSYLKHAGVPSVEKSVERMKNTMAAEKAEEEAEIQRVEDEIAELYETYGSSSSDSGSSSSSSSGSGSGSYTGGSSGRWKPNSGGGLGGSGKIYGGSSSSGSSSSSSSSSSSKDLNGWADYDEGYDDVMYNDEYDEERYQTDSEYASGVDDARDEYEEVYGEEFD